jgi:hypothetical protein
MSAFTYRESDDRNPEAWAQLCPSFNCRGALNPDRGGTKTPSTRASDRRLIDPLIRPVEAQLEMDGHLLPFG